eukprot:CAMPEP_0201281144 /NCGR_PEP_ID=MMETSP1317-20130820/1670_1 /ASSEMBLY_ACC=CAM_ASM_000770 /TAXON_ID=187299 /ORGANISM="Undescribed Undescribed, Strain Undescribed" /LENGTH=145 /DNA_ID=CAMNT_0047590259 /DNA_START=49 /DNA_END=483 /DNA_ORIENTATION=-
MTSNDEDAATVSGALTFTTSNWSLPQTVTITGVEDDDTSDETVTITHAVTSTDTDYDGFTADDVIATITDDDIAGVTLSQTTVSLAENTNGTYTINLLTEPTDDVTITMTSNDEDAATVSGALTFTTSNWSLPQTVTITGVEDDD